MIVDRDQETKIVEEIGGVIPEKGGETRGLEGEDEVQQVQGQDLDL